MKKLVKYFSIAAAIFFATSLVIALFYIRFVYQALVSNNEGKLPPAIVRLIEKFSKTKPAPAPQLRAEETIRVLEGWTTRDIGQYFAAEGKWTEKEFLDESGWPMIDYRNNKKKPELRDWSNDFPFLQDKPEYYGLEGYLYPDTYRIYASSTISEVIEKMLGNFDSKLDDKMRADIKKQGKSIYEIVTMASIIEKEAPLNYATGDNREARIISGIFWNRLEIGQGLQSDATLTYIFGDNNPAHSGKDLEIDSPYNTYKYRGLPPGPIANPGILAIQAAIYPIATDYYYFLTSPGDNNVYYARSYDEHLKNKYKYLK